MKRIVAIAGVLWAGCQFSDPPHQHPDAPIAGGDAPVDAPVDAPADAPGITPMLVAIAPAVAKTGAVVRLEGTFAAGATVHFPGGVDADAVVDGIHRARVIVPAGATTGALSVTTGGATVGALDFRRASFALGLQNFQEPYEQTSGGRQSPTLPKAGANFACATAHGTVYVIGGGSPGGVLDTVQAARVDADSTLKPFAVVAHLTTPRYEPVAQVIGDYLYVLGGGSATSVGLTSIERAKIHADGSLDAFAVVASTLVVGRATATSHIIGDRIYVIGVGGGATGLVASIESAPIAVDGSLGTFALAAAGLAQPRGSHASAVLGDWLYVLGGLPASGTVSTVERAPIAADGTLGAFAVVDGLTFQRSELVAARLGDKLYLVGGGGPSGTTDVNAAAIGGDGTLGPIAAVAGVTQTHYRKSPAVALVGNYLYLFGGADGSYLASTEHAQIGAPASLSAFATVAGVSLIDARWSYASATIGHQVYVFGGYGATADLTRVEHAPIAADGTLGPFVQGQPLVSARGGSGAAVIGNYVYIFSGYDGTTTLTTVERAAIQPDDTLGPFAIVAGLTVAPRFEGRAVVLGNYVYLLTGDYNSGPTQIERAAIAADGTLGAFATVSGVNLVQHGKGPSFAVVRGAVIVGGGAHGSYDATVQRATIAADGTLSTFASVGALPANDAAAVTAVLGGALYVVGGSNESGALKTIWKATVNADGTVGAFAATSPLATANGCELGCGWWIGNYFYTAGGGGASVLAQVSAATVQ